MDAERFATRMEHEKTRGEWIDPQRGQATLAEWVAQWWPTVVSLSTSSRVRLRGIIDNHVLPRFGPVQLARITQPSVALWVADLQALGLSSASVQKCHQALTRILNGAVRAELIRRNVAADVELPVVRSQEMRFLTAEEVDDLAAVHPQRYRAMVLVAAYGGFRFGELAGLRRRRIDLAGNVRVEETCVEVAGHLVWGAPKTEAGRRSVALPSFVVSALREHQARYSQPGPEGLVFTAPAGGQLRRSNFRHKVWLPSIARAGLDGLRFHDLRHTAVALWVAAGANVLEVKQRAGHTRSTFTLDRYGHLFPNADAGLASRLDDLYGHKGPDGSGDIRRLSS